MDWNQQEKDQCLTQGSSSHYQVLRLPVTATDKEIKVAYPQAARRGHPDHGGDAAVFRQVTLAYETLIDPKRRAAYDRSYAHGSAEAATADGAHFDAPAAGSRASATVHRPNTPRNTAGDPPVYVPPFEHPESGSVPLIPEELASRQIHGMPRKRGIFGAEARIQREMRTVQLISRQVLPAIPAARLINRAAVTRRQQPHRPRAAVRLPAGADWIHAVAEGCLRLERKHADARRPCHCAAAACPYRAAHAGHLPGAQRDGLDRDP